MFKIVIFVTICVGVLGFPQIKEASKHPKKYDEKIHSTDKKVLAANPPESSYTDYTESDQMESMTPPSEVVYFQDANDESISSLPQFSQDEYSFAVEDPIRSILPPPEDTYTSYNNDALYSLLPPNKEAQSSDDYLGYTDARGEMSDYIRAPELSSYSEVEPQYNIDSQSDFYSDGLSPPALSDMDDENTVQESSYLNFEQPEISSYDSYNRQSSEFRMNPPPVLD